MTIGQVVTAAAEVAPLIGGSFTSVFPIITYISEVVTNVEAATGPNGAKLTGPQKLALAQKTITDGLEKLVPTIPALAKLVGNPAQLETAISQIVSIANLFIK